MLLVWCDCEVKSTEVMEGNHHEECAEAFSPKKLACNSDDSVVGRLQRLVTCRLTGVDEIHGL